MPQQSHLKGMEGDLTIPPPLFNMKLKSTRLKLPLHGLVVGFHEKVKNPPGSRANGAVYIFEPEVVDFIASLGKQWADLSTEVIPHFLGRISVFHNAEYHRDIGSPESLLRAESEF